MDETLPSATDFTPVQTRHERRGPGTGPVLTAAQVLRIKSRLRAHESVTKIARDFGVTTQTIYYIAQGKTWKQVEPTQELVAKVELCARLELGWVVVFVIDGMAVVERGPLLT